jgi:hypothetical protein
MAKEFHFYAHLPLLGSQRETQAPLIISLPISCIAQNG